MTITHPEATEQQRRYLSPEQVCDIIPGMTKGNLAQLRFKGEGPRYRRVTARTIVYAEDDVYAWVESTARQGTAATA